MVSLYIVLLCELGFHPVMFFLPHNSDHNRSVSAVRAADRIDHSYFQATGISQPRPSGGDCSV